ncbi:MAG: heavy metal translocating P-type ATPase [Candidatus Flemingibacterium sp.]|nr:heavy metal translocating P-type ATPase [Candidatus Flemingibacterium sp.]
MKVKFSVEGMSCAACSASVERVSKRVEGVTNAEVNLLAKTLVVECEKDTPELRQKIITAVEKAGFTAAPADQKVEEAAIIKEDKKKEKSEAENMKRRLIASVAILAVLMYLTMGHMVGLPTPHIFHGTENLVVFAFTQLLLTLPIVYLNRKFYIVGFKALWNRSPNMDSLVAVGSAAALVYGVFAIYMIGYGLGHGDLEIAKTYGSNLYFESAAMILTLVSVGKFLEERSKNKTGAAVEHLMKLAPDTAIVEKNGVQVEVKTSALQVGDIIIVKPGQSLPADGTIVEGSSSIDESALTGESIPVEKTVGSRVMTASINKTGSFKFRAEKVGGETALAKIIDLVRDAGATKAPIAKLADKVSGIFVPVVMSIAAVTLIVWLILGRSFDFALSRGISVLVISCPCALGLATPVAVTVSVGRLAERGILVKSAEALEILHDTKTVALDKTGTITEGHPSVTDVISENEDELLTVAAALEASSEHPLAEAIRAYTDEKGFAPAKVDEFSAVPGRGVNAIMDGKKIAAGNIAFMKEIGVVQNDEYPAILDELAKKGRTPMFFAVDGKLAGIIAVADRIKPTSADAISKLHSMNVKTMMLTGDNRLTAEAIAKEAGVDDVTAEVLPQDKERVVDGLRKNGIVTFVGDGINDSPALTRADVGIAIGSGADIAIDSADIVLMKNDLGDVPTAIDFSRRTIRNIRQNLFWAFFYNTLGIPVAAGVLAPLGVTLSPMLGAAAMSLSSLFVVTNALRLYKIKML